MFCPWGCLQPLTPTSHPPNPSGLAPRPLCSRRDADVAVPGGGGGPCDKEPGVEQDEASTTQTPSKEELEPREFWGSVQRFSLSPTLRGCPLFFSLCGSAPAWGGRRDLAGGAERQTSRLQSLPGSCFPLFPPKFCCKQSHLSSPSPRVHPDQRQAAHVGQEAGKSGRVPRGRTESDLIEPPRPHRAPLCPSVQPLVF